MPFELEVLNKYDYLYWFDTKLKVYCDKIINIVYELDNLDKSLVFVKHPYSDNYSSIWNEYDLALNYKKYAKEKEQYNNYIT